jgi:Type IV secretion system pilin
MSKIFTFSFLAILFFSSFFSFKPVLVYSCISTDGYKCGNTQFGNQTTNTNQNITPTQTENAKPIDVCKGLGTSCIGGISEAETGRGSDAIVKIIMQIVWFLIYIASAVAIFYIVLGGYSMITSNGNDEGYKKGLSTLKNASIGLVLCILSATIVLLVSQVALNIKFFNL